MVAGSVKTSKHAWYSLMKREAVHRGSAALAACNQNRKAEQRERAWLSNGVTSSGGPAVECAADTANHLRSKYRLACGQSRARQVRCVLPILRRRMRHAMRAQFVMTGSGQV
jgi:hypothetical protein